jgi:hypothetical protein
MHVAVISAMFSVYSIKRFSDVPLSCALTSSDVCIPSLIEANLLHCLIVPKN